MPRHLRAALWLNLALICGALGCSGALAPLEETFAAPGPLEVQTLTVDDGLLPLADGTAVFATAPVDRSRRWPVLVWANGSESSPDLYAEMLSHFASWGIATFAVEDPAMGDGGRAWELVQHLAVEDEQDGGPLQGALDVEQVATMGTSQGATGAINAHAKFDAPDAPVIKAIAVNALPALWFCDPDDVYDAGAVRVPLFIAGGSLDTIISPPEENFARLNEVVSPGASVAAHQVNAHHLSINHDGGPFRGYFTAWLRAHLFDDEEASSVFIPDEGELFANPLWTDVRAYRAAR